MKVLIVPPQAGLALALARLLLLGGQRRHPAVGLATGKTYQPFLDQAAAAAQRGEWEAGRYRFTHLDEFVGFAARDQGGMAHELQARLFSRLDPPAKDFLAWNGRSDPKTAARRQERALAAFGPLDVQFLGLGCNGHVAFNEPGSSFGLRCRETALLEETQRDLKQRFPTTDCPARAFSLGPANILEAHELWMMAFGSRKAPAVVRLLEGPLSPRCPATLLRLHPRATLVLDGASAALIGARARWRPEALSFWCGETAELSCPGPVAVICPHPDDGALSCGGLLASLPDTVPRHLLQMTSGSHASVPGCSPEQVARQREQECREEGRRLGAQVHFLHGIFYESQSLEEADVVRLLALLDEIQPAWVLAPSRLDPHPTHALSRQIADEALRRHLEQRPRPLTVWTTEGPWYQHPRDQVNTLVRLSPQAEERKQKAIRAHQTQVVRVPFHQGAQALARLRGVAFSESHLGAAKQPLGSTPVLEVYRRERYPSLQTS